MRRAILIITITAGAIFGGAVTLNAVEDTNNGTIDRNSITFTEMLTETMPGPFIGWGTEISSVCFEDMPCWNCKTMGNKICGPLPRTN